MASKVSKRCETCGTEGTMFTVHYVPEVKDNWLKRGIREIKKELKKWPKWKRTTKQMT